MTVETVRGLALCWTVERRDGAGIALTSHDQDVPVEGVVYRAAPGMVPSAIERQLGMEANDSEASGALQSAALTEADLIAGRWDGARVRLRAVDWDRPDEPPTELLCGTLGTITMTGATFRAALQGTAAQLSRPICPQTSSECRAQFGDRQCRVDLAGRRLRAVVVGTVEDAIRLDGPIDDAFLWGRARWIDGANTGVASAIVAIDGDRIALRERSPQPIVAGDRIELTHGCDKRFATCSDRFANAANFRGEPHLPGNDLLTRYPGA